jgi:hypothetical protein
VCNVVRKRGINFRIDSLVKNAVFGNVPCPAKNKKGMDKSD